jgi:hypothetical protein
MSYPNFSFKSSKATTAELFTAAAQVPMLFVLPFLSGYFVHACVLSG